MNFRQKIAEFAAYRRTVRELRVLSARQLNDVGLTLFDIKDAARGLVR